MAGLGGEGKKAENFGSAFARLYILLITNYERNTRQKTTLYHNNRKEWQENIATRLQKLNLGVVIIRK